MSQKCPKQACLDMPLVEKDFKYSSLSDSVSDYI